MIKYALQCDQDHGFESWFSNSASFDMQAKRGFVTCPVCNSARVTKQIMAPRVVTSEKQAAVPQEVAVPVPPPPSAVEAVFDGNAAGMREMVRAFRSFVTANTEDVGRQFADESRKMHYGTVEGRAIRGEASQDDVQELLEEGIRIMPMPILPEDRN
jgi:hypothetical protein